MTKPKTTKPASPWRPIKTAPMCGEPFIGLERGKDFGFTAGNVAQTMFFNGRDFVPFSGFYICLPTHWMPIPPLPEGER